MRTASANYTTYNTGARLNPVWAVEIGGSNTKFVSGDFLDISSPPVGVTYHKLITNVEITVPELQFKEGHYTPMTFIVVIRDLMGVFTTFLNGLRIYGAACVIKFGFAEIAYSDFLTMTPGGSSFYEMEISTDGLYFTIRARDSLYGILSKVVSYPYPFSHLLQLFDPLAAGTTGSIHISGITGFYSANQTDFMNLLDERVFCGFQTYPLAPIYSSVVEEIIKFEVTDTVNDELETMERGLGFTGDVSHIAGAPFKWCGGFRCDVLRGILHLLLNTTTGANGAYDLGINQSGSSGIKYHILPFAGLTYSTVDVESIERLGWRIFNEYEYDPEGSFYHFPGDGIDTKEFIEQFILKPYGLYLYMNNNKISIGSFDIVYFLENFSAQATFTSANIEAVTSISFSIFDEAKKERYYFFGEYNAATQIFGENGTVEYDIPGLTDTPVEDAQIQYENHGVNFSTTSKQRSTAYLNLIRNYALREVCLLIKIRCKYQMHIYEVGDQALLTLANVPDIANSVRGLTNAKALIVESEVDGINKNVSFTLRLFETPGYLSDQLGGLYQVFKIAEGSINDKTLSVSATETATTEAADAYYDNSGTNYRGDIVMFRLRITQPAFGAGSNHEILSLKFSLLDDVPAIKVADYRRYIRFNPQSSAAFEFDVYVANDDSDYDSGGGVAVNIPHRVKVDWISTTATGSEIPTVELIGVWFIRFDL